MHVDGISLQAYSQLKSVGCVRGLAATWCPVCINQTNRVNSRNGFDDSTVNIVTIRAGNGSMGHGSWVMGQMGHENGMGHMGHGSLGDDP